MKSDNSTQICETILVSASDAARMCGVSRRTWFRLAASAKVPSCVRVGSSPRWVRTTLESWIAMGCPSRREFEARMETENTR